MTINNSEDQDYTFSEFYEDQYGRKIHIFHSCRRKFIPRVSIGFYPTADALFDYQTIVEVLENQFLSNFDYKVSIIEIAFDFYGTKITKIKKTYLLQWEKTILHLR